MATDEPQKRKRATRASLEDIAKMADHLYGTHEVPTSKLFAQSFSKLAAIHDGFHGRDDHWKA